MKKQHGLSRVIISVLLLGLLISFMSCAGTSTFIKKEDALNDSSLVNYIAFDEGKENVITDNCNNTIENKSSGDLSWKQGKYGSSIHFNGSDSYIQINGDKLKDIGKQGDQYTVCLWVNTSTAGSSDWMTGPVITEKRSIGGRERTFLIYLNVNNSAGVHFEEPHEEVEGNKPINDGKWHHVAVVRNSGEVQIYIDGEPDTKGKIQDNDKSSTGFPITIGCRRLNEGAPSAYYEGQVDDYFIFTKALSQGDIKAVMGE